MKATKIKKGHYEIKIKDVVISIYKTKNWSAGISDYSNYDFMVKVDDCLKREYSTKADIMSDLCDLNI